MKRVNPLGAETAAVESNRLDLEQPGQCPLCVAANQNGQMQITNAGASLAYVCQQHCVCLPVEDENPAWATFTA